MTTPGNNIRRLRETRDWTQADLAKRMGRTNVTISRWESGSRVFNSKDLRKLAEVLRVSPQEILGDGIAPATAQRPGRPSKKNRPDIPGLDFDDQSYLARSPELPLIKGGKQNGTVRFEETTIRRCTSAPFDQLQALEVSDETMIPVLNPGDLTLVDMTITKVESDGIFAIHAQDGASTYVRRISVDPVSGRLTITADNPAYKSFEDVDPDAIAIVGRVVWKSQIL